MLQRCMNCGWRGDFEDLNSHEEHIGDCFGFPAYERFYYCPQCGSEEIEDEDADLIPYTDEEDE